MARYAAAGARVTLVTCTLGEEGEIYVPELAGLAASDADQLGGYRAAELIQACKALGVTDHRFLGGAGRYRDSGMMGVASNHHPRAFWGADVDEAAGHLVGIFREVRPQVLVTYDPHGFYGHPDHIQAHRVAMRAAELAGEAAPVKIYWTALPHSVMREGWDEFCATFDNPFPGVEWIEDLPFGTPDDQITTRIDAAAYGDHKLAALRAHATQIPPDSWLWSLARGFGEKAMGVEYYTLAIGKRGPAAGPHDWETDFFAGVTLSS